MKYIIFLILLIALISTVFYFDRKQAILKHQLLVANNQNSSLRSKLSKLSKSTTDSIKIKFSVPTNYIGLLKENSKVLIAPIENSTVLQKTQIKMEVKILDRAEVLRETWFYVALPIDSNINSRGWVKQSNFSLFYNNSKSITNRF